MTTLLRRKGGMRAMVYRRCQLLGPLHVEFDAVEA